MSLSLHFVTFWCYRGKQRQRQSGFFWVAPRCLTNKFDNGVHFTSAYLDLISHRQALELAPPRFLIFDVQDKYELAGSAIQASLQQSLSTKLDNPEQMDANAWRRLGPTWAHRCGLSRDDENALGDWVSGKESSLRTPLIYSTAKMRASKVLKATLWHFLESLEADAAWGTLSGEQLQDGVPIFKQLAEQDVIRDAAAPAEWTNDWAEEVPSSHTLVPTHILARRWKLGKGQRARPPLQRAMPPPKSFHCPPGMEKYGSCSGIKQHPRPAALQRERNLPEGGGSQSSKKRKMGAQPGPSSSSVAQPGRLPLVEEEGS